MEFKGTKGKWSITEDLEVINESGFCLFDNAYPSMINVNWHKLGLNHWADKKGVGYIDISEEEAEANALLISKAPEMLKMLNEIRNAILSEDQTRILAYSQKAKELIKEATEL